MAADMGEALETVQSCPPGGPRQGFWLQAEVRTPVQDWGVNQMYSPHPLHCTWHPVSTEYMCVE